MNNILLVISQEGSTMTINNAVCAMLKYKNYEFIEQPIEIIFPK